MSNPFVSFKVLKETVSMSQLLEHYGLLSGFKPQGTDGLAGACPLHGGTNPTQFKVSISKNCWHCFGGCRGGNVLDFVMAMEKVEVRQAALLLSQWFGVGGKDVRSAKAQPAGGVEATAKAVKEPALTPTSPPETAAPAGEKPGEEINPPLRFAGLKDLDPTGLVSRGFTPTTLEAFGAGMCRRGLMKDRIAMPIHHPDGALVAYAGLAPEARAPEPVKYPDGFHREWEVFNLHRARREDPHWITEDFLDVLRLHEAGYIPAVALMGQALSPVQERLLLTAWGVGAPVVVVMAPVAEVALVVIELAQWFSVRYLSCQPRDMTVDALRAFLAEAGMSPPSRDSFPR